MTRILKTFAYSLYTALWTYALTDTLFPSYHYLTYIFPYGFIETHHRTGLKDIALFNERSFYLSLIVFVLVWICLELRNILLKKEYMKTICIIDGIGIADKATFNNITLTNGKIYK